MIIDFRKLKSLGKTEENFFFEYTVERNLIDIPNVKLDDNVKVTGTLTLAGEHSCYVDGEVCFSLKGECSRCLDFTEREYIVEFSEFYEPNNSEGYSVIKDTVNLTEMVEDLIITNAPISFLCKEDCKGICLGCKVNLNKEDCKCQK